VKHWLATIVICLSVALVAVSVRLLLWQDNRPLFARVFSGMVEHHRANARLLLDGDVTQFVSGPAPPGDANILTYPPGYPLIMALVFRVFGERESAMRIFQILCDAIAAVVLFFLAAELLPRRAAVVAAMLAALSPQLAYYSLLLLPDSLATLPILLALCLAIRAVKFESIVAVIGAGFCIGLSCWLRSNALLLAPFLAALMLIVLRPKLRWRFSAALAGASLLVMAPITIRNAIVFHHFVPLSLGAGQMLNVGIGDYDKQRTFGLPGSDLETVTSEAERYGRNDYASSLFGGGGVERDQRRFSRGLAVVRAHPLWFGSVVLRRALSMLRLERVRSVSAEPSPTRYVESGKLVWSPGPAELGAAAVVTTYSESPLHAEEGRLEIRTPVASQQAAIAYWSVPVEKNTDYLLKLSVAVDRGNLMASIVDNERVLAATPVLHPQETIDKQRQPTFKIDLPFASRDAGSVQVVLGNEGKRPVETKAAIGGMQLFELGPSSFVWIRYPRLLIHAIQNFFITAWLLPFALAGALLLLAAGQGRYLLLLLVVPLYYFCFQSLLHTEYRYVMAIQYTLFVMVAATLYWLTVTLKDAWSALRRRSRPGV